MAVAGVKTVSPLFNFDRNIIKENHRPKTLITIPRGITEMKDTIILCNSQKVQNGKC